MEVVDYSRASAFAPSGQGPTHLSNAAGSGDYVPNLGIGGNEPDQCISVQFWHEPIRIFQKADGFNDRD